MPVLEPLDLPMDRPTKYFSTFPILSVEEGDFPVRDRSPVIFDTKKIEHKPPPRRFSLTINRKSKERQAAKRKSTDPEYLREEREPFASRESYQNRNSERRASTRRYREQKNANAVKTNHSRYGHQEFQEQDRSRKNTALNVPSVEEFDTRTQTGSHYGNEEKDFFEEFEERFDDSPLQEQIINLEELQKQVGNVMFFSFAFFFLKMFFSDFWVAFDKLKI